jgi:hypothetical protein
MVNLSSGENQIQYVTDFQELVSTPFWGEVNAICWNRKLVGDFAEIIDKIEIEGNITEIDQEQLLGLQLSELGNLAREIILNDLKLLIENGASPVLNVIEYYERDDFYPLFPTDVYSFHVDRAPIPTSTFLCTYSGEASEILPNSQGIQKISIPEIRTELQKLHLGSEVGFEDFLKENFFDLHYQASTDAKPINLGIGHIWRLAVDHPQSPVAPSLHRAPKEKNGEKRLLLIC